MGISNLTSSIRGVTGTERITGIQKLETTTIVAQNASIAGISVGATVALTHMKTSTASMLGISKFRGSMSITPEATTGGYQTVVTLTATRSGVLTSNGWLYGSDYTVTASVTNSGRNFSMMGFAAKAVKQSGTALNMGGLFGYVLNEAGSSGWGVGVESWVENTGGTTTKGYGMSQYIARTGGTFTNAIAYHSDIDGVIGTAKGIRIELDDVTGSRWGIHITNDEQNVLAGDLKIGGRIDAGANIKVQEDGYVNFNATIGTNGFGLRDINGSVQFKHSGGTWTDMS